MLILGKIPVGCLPLTFFTMENLEEVLLRELTMRQKGLTRIIEAESGANRIYPYVFEEMLCFFDFNQISTVQSVAYLLRKYRDVLSRQSLWTLSERLSYQTRSQGEIMRILQKIMKKEDEGYCFFGGMAEKEKTRLLARSRRMVNHQCAICCTFKQKEWITVPCMGKHKFHRECISRWFDINTNCPLCKQKIVVDASSNLVDDIAVAPPIDMDFIKSHYRSLDGSATYVVYPSLEKGVPPSPVPTITLKQVRQTKKKQLKKQRHPHQQNGTNSIEVEEHVFFIENTGNLVEEYCS